jgi:glycerol-3-phosphate acyltransferase PlsX
VLLDVGANIDAKPRHYLEFAVMGHFYAQAALGVESPRVGLLSVGEEASKGTELLRMVHQALQESRLCFVGNVEGTDLFSGRADVVVCDGYVGNALLKSAESMALLLEHMLRDRLSRGWRTRFGGWLARPALADLRRRTDPDEHGAAPLLGVRAGCFIAHGRSSPRGIRSSIRSAVEFLRAGVHEQIRERLEEMAGDDRTTGGENG